MSNPDIGALLQNAQKTQIELDCTKHAITVVERQRQEALTRVVQVEVELEMVKRQTTHRIGELEKALEGANARVDQLQAELDTGVTDVVVNNP